MITVGSEDLPACLGAGCGLGGMGMGKGSMIRVQRPAQERGSGRPVEPQEATPKPRWAVWETLEHAMKVVQSLWCVQNGCQSQLSLPEVPRWVGCAVHEVS